MGGEKTIQTCRLTGICSFESHRKRCSNRWNCTFSVHSFRQMLEHLQSQGLRCWDSIGLERQHRWTKDSRRPCITPSNFSLQTSLSLTWFRSLGLHYDFFSLSQFYPFHGPAWPLGIPAAAAKSLQSCPTLCDPIDGLLPGSHVPGILQARTLEWVAISFSNAWKWKVKVKSLSHVWLLATLWTAAYQAPPSMGFGRQEYWSGLPLPSPLGIPRGI